MATNKRYTVRYRRKQEGKTDYKQRLRLLMSERPRLVVRRSLSNITAQLVAYEENGDKVSVTVRSNDLKAHGLTVINTNVPTSYLTGLLLGTKAKAAGIKEAVVDVGLQKLSHEGRLFAVIKGVVDAGLDIHASDKHFPSDDRVSGKHIEQYATALKEERAAFEKQFKAYLAAKIDPVTISTVFAQVKEKIIGTSK